MQRKAKKREMPALCAVSESDDDDDGSSSGDEVSVATGGDGGDGGNGRGGRRGDHVESVIKSRIRLVVAIWLILGALVAWVMMKVSVSNLGHQSGLHGPPSLSLFSLR